MAKVPVGARRVIDIASVANQGNLNKGHTTFDVGRAQVRFVVLIEEKTFVVHITQSRVDEVRA